MFRSRFYHKGLGAAYASRSVGISGGCSAPGSGPGTGSEHDFIATQRGEGHPSAGSGQAQNTKGREEATNGKWGENPGDVPAANPCSLLKDRKTGSLFLVIIYLTQGKTCHSVLKLELEMT